MSEDKKLGEIIRQKLSEDDFTFDEGNWEKAKGMIDAADKRKKRIGFFILFAIIGSIASVVLFTYTGGTKKTNTVLSVKNNSETKINPSENPVVEHSENTTVKKDNGTSKKDNGTSKRKTGNQKQSVNQQKETATTDVNTKKTIPKANTLSNANKKIKGNTVQKKTANTIVKKKDSSVKTNLISGNNKKTKTVKEKEIKTVVENKTGADSVKTAMTNSVLSSENKIDLSNKKEDSLLANTISPDKNTTAEKISSDTLKNTKADSVTAAKQKEPEQKTTLTENVEPKNVLAFEAGAGYMMGWANASGKDANGINPVVGINYLRFLNKKFAFSLGVQFNSIGNLSLSNYTAVNSQYDFGMTTTYTTITPKMLYYLVAPLKINYSINSKNSFGVGCNIAYLLNTSSSIETYGDVPTVRTVKRGYVKGFATFDFQVALLYRRQLYKNLGINTELFYGLTDIKNNIFYNSPATEKNMGVKLTLFYNFLKR